MSIRSWIISLAAALATAVALPAMDGMQTARPSDARDENRLK